MCHGGKFYKTNGVEGKWISLSLVLLCCQNLFDCVLLVRVGIFKLEKEWKLFLARQAWKLLCSGFLCVAPLRLRGIRGKKSTPSIGWEVPVKSLDWKASRIIAQAFGLKITFSCREIWSWYLIFKIVDN
jgi:hypothetical protein